MKMKYITSDQDERSVLEMELSLLKEMTDKMEGEINTIVRYH